MRKRESGRKTEGGGGGDRGGRGGGGGEKRRERKKERGREGIHTLSLCVVGGVPCAKPSPWRGGAGAYAYEACTTLFSPPAAAYGLRIQV